MNDAARELTLLIPAFNEEATIGRVVGEVRRHCGEILHEVLVVDDGSSDATAARAEESGARVIRHDENRGYGAALLTAIRAAGTEYVLTMDGDGQHRAEDVRILWQARTHHDMVIGQRRTMKQSPLWRRPGKWVLSRVANYLTGRKIPDLNSGLRLMRRSIASRYLHLCPRGFSFSTTITMTFLTRGYRVLFEPIEINSRTGRSTVHVGTGFDTLILILRITALFNPLRLFIPMSLVAMAAGFIWTIPYVLAGRGISIASMLAIVTGILLFGLGLICDQISQLRLERFE